MRSSFVSARTLAAVCLLFIPLIGCLGSRGDAVAMPPLQGRDEVTLVVQGLSCPLCAHNLDKTLLGVPGVRSAVVDLSTGSVRVGIDPTSPPTAEALAKCVSDSGFTLKEIR